jgi:large subunit ribosomal protein L23
VDDHNVIVRPIITEQTTHFATVRNAYAFEVNRKANKAQIKNAVERLYSVTVTDVRTANLKGKPRRRGRMMGQTATWKKAVVVLAEDNKIDLF